MIFNDPEIREILKNYLTRLPIKPRLVIEELHIHRGNAIADVVALYKETHGYEIKGDNDNINRIKKQGHFYDLAFKKITLVTTTKHKRNALKNAPLHWGILIINFKKNKVIIKHERKASHNPHFSKSVAIQTLWRNEMLSMVKEHNLDISTKLNKIDLATKLASHLDKQTIHHDVANKLVSRKSQTLKNKIFKHKSNM